MSMRSYFKPLDNESLFGEALQTSSGEMSSTQVCVAKELNALMQQKETKKKRQVVPEDVRREVGLYANKCGIPAACKWASDRYKGYEFKSETVRDWRNLYHAKDVNEETTSNEKGPGRPSVAAQELTAEIKMILHNLRIADCTTSRKTAIAVAVRVLLLKKWGLYQTDNQMGS